MGRKKNVDIKMQLCCNVSYYSRNVETTCHQNDIYSNKAVEKKSNGHTSVLSGLWETDLILK